MVHRVAEVIAFGEALIKTGDLDPVYIGLVNAKLPKRQLERLLLAYFCFYHLGASAYISEYENDEFWDVMEQAAENQMPPSGTDSQLSFDRWPRASERRHFRGPKCEVAVKQLAEYPPEYFVQTLAMASRGKDLSLVMGWVQQKPLFGPWVAFKVADILERVLSVPIIFPSDLTLFYKEPRAALDLLDVPAETANVKLLKHFRRITAPPRYERYCNIQEVETCACKFKSYVNGHYWVGKDIHEVRKGLIGWGTTAECILKAMPQEVERGLFV
jgi:Alpha-glutamyl/putrescinyl thymine pyrophosphorylase clade 2